MSGENPIRDAFDAVADSDDPAEASVRPQGTTGRELRAMRRDVLRKLQVESGARVVEIGCGVGLLGVPVAERAGHYLGLDLAPRAVRVASRRLADAGLGESRASARCVDVLSITGRELAQLGRFDRVVVYAVLHYVRDDSEGTLLLQRTLDLLLDGGIALVGNLPLEDLAIDWTPPDPPPRGVLQRARVGGRWILTSGSAAVPLTRRWKTRRAIERVIKLRKLRLESPLGDFTVPLLPDDYTVPLSTERVQGWLAEVRGDFSYRWELPAPNVPLAVGRADLILYKS